jgi:hypothetical protein
MTPTTYEPEDLLNLCAYAVEKDADKVGEWTVANVKNNRDGWVLLYTLAYLFKDLNLFRLTEGDLLIIRDKGAPGYDDWACLSAARIITTMVNGDEDTTSALLDTVVMGGQKAFLGVFAEMLSVTGECLRRELERKGI